MKDSAPVPNVAPRIKDSIFLIYDVEEGQYWKNQNGKTFWKTAADAKRSRAVNLIYRYKTNLKGMTISEKYPVVQVSLDEASPVFVG